MAIIQVVKNINEANAITHGGVFHADDVFATALYSYVIYDVRVARVFKVPEIVPAHSVVYDVGFDYNPELNRFDHHQRFFEEKRENGVKYSSFGLLWRQFGRIVILSQYDMEDNLVNAVLEAFDNEFVAGIDAADNGQLDVTSNVQVASVSNIISSFNPNWDEKANSDERFLLAVETATVIFENALNRVISKVKAATAVENAIEKSTDGIMVLDTFMPWQDYVFGSANPKATGMLYVLFPSLRGGWNVQAVPDFLGGHGQRKPLPKEWAGLTGVKMAEVSGVPTANFCHNGRFMCSAATFEDAMALAMKAIEA